MHNIQKQKIIKRDDFPNTDKNYQWNIIFVSVFC